MDVPTINIGVPQGLILEPLLIIIYIFYIMICSPKGTVVSFMDETEIFYTEKINFQPENFHTTHVISFAYPNLLKLRK